MKKFIITEEEKKHIRRLYEQEMLPGDEQNDTTETTSTQTTGGTQTIYGTQTTGGTQTTSGNTVTENIKSRFFSLMESKMGNVKTLISEQITTDDETLQDQSSASETQTAEILPKKVDKYHLEPNYHRYKDGGDPGIETFFENPSDERVADELQSQLETDKYARGPEFLRRTNIGRGTGKMYIYLNGVKMTPAQFIDKVQEDYSEGYKHTIINYEYNNRFIGTTEINIDTDVTEVSNDKEI